MTQQDVTGSPVALYRLYDAGGELLYVGLTDNLGARLDEHANSKPWWGDVTRRTAEWLPSRVEARKAEAAAILNEEPRYNLMRPRQGRPRQGGPPRPSGRDRHAQTPISIRPPKDDRAWLEAYARQAGRPVRAILVEALARERARQEAGTMALTDTDRSLITRARTLAGVGDEAALRQHTGETDRVLLAYVRALGEAKDLLGALADRLDPPAQATEEET